MAIIKVINYTAYVGLVMYPSIASPSTCRMG